MVKRRERYLYQKRSLSQVFLTTDWPVIRFADQLEQLGAREVLEVGPGNGIMTKVLLSRGFKVTAVEKDDRFAARLEGMRQGDLESQLRVVNADILKFDLGAWIEEAGSHAAVVGNIPYNISSPLILLCLQHIDALKGLLFMTQLEFAARLAAPPSNKDYGSLSVFTQLRAKVKLDCKVERTCFNPVPKVDSALVFFQPLRERLSDERLRKVELVTRSAFLQRRKMLSNSLASFLKDVDEQRAPIDLNRRADSLSPDEYRSLADFLLPD